MSVNIKNVGVSSNSWLITADKNILIDGEAKQNEEAFLKNIKKELGEKKLDAFIANHAAPSRIGVLEALLKEYPSIEVYSSIAGLRNIEEILNHNNFSSSICKNNMSVSIGDLELSFIITPNVPWPDTMMTYLKNEKALFSSFLFSSLNGSLEEFYNSNLRFSEDFTFEAVDRAKAFDIDMVFPALGKMLTFAEAKNIYEQIPKFKFENDILIVYQSQTGNTKACADKIEELAIKNGLTAKSINLKNNANITALFEKSKGIILGVPTENRNMPYEFRMLFANLCVPMLHRKPYFVFGSNGWSGEGAVIAEATLKNYKMNKASKTETYCFAPTEDDINRVLAGAMKLIKEVKTNA